PDGRAPRAPAEPELEGLGHRQRDDLAAEEVAAAAEVEVGLLVDDEHLVHPDRDDLQAGGVRVLVLGLRGAGRGSAPRGRTVPGRDPVAGATRSTGRAAVAPRAVAD